MGAMVERASSVPLSASCMVNRAEMLALVERARAELPVELDQAAELLVAHQEVISRAETEAEQLLAQAQADAERMIMETALVASARARSEQILDAARAEAARLLRECDLYCDNRLAALEDDLHRTLGQVRRGRDRLRDRSELDYLDPLPDEADPEGRDVQAEYEQAVEREPEEEQWRPARSRDEAYDQYEQVAVASEDAYDQERENQAEVDRAGAPGGAQGPAPDEPEPAVPEGDTPDTAGADLTGPPASSGSSEENPQPRVPAGIGTGLATGPERRVLDLTAIERAAERSGLG
ncbi:hypothetical protein Kisp01_31670 [Kineosporia sp. NBRC 101677]|nr:hypothetical protein Kisp01_31670 [Kineosporia sp. NBRC 101677]